MTAKRQRGVSLSEEAIKEVQAFADFKEWSWSKAAGKFIEQGPHVVTLIAAARIALENIRGLHAPGDNWKEVVTETLIIALAPFGVEK